MIKITEERLSIIFLIPIMTFIGSVIVLDAFKDAQATGGAGEIKGIIDPIIERAITALENNNTELALEEIQTLKNELDDTFSADKDESEESEED